MKKIPLLLFSLLICQYNYSLEDINSASNSYESFISPSSFEGNITLHYFGHQN